MTVETMKTGETFAERENEKNVKEVIIYESGNPVLKVESGTTLKVLKLLYGAEQERKQQILGVRPKNIVEGIPCIITLDESKLSDISYDVLISEDSKEKKEIKNDETTTSRCIDCSRESWKTKRFTNVGMNTEISLNPDTDVDLSKITTNSQSSSLNTNTNNSNQTVTEKPTYPNKGHTQNQQHSPSSAPSRGGNPSFLHQKEFIAAHATKATHNGGTPHREENDRAHHDRPATSPTYGVEVYNNHRGTQIRYPSLEPPMHYDRFVHPHGWMVDGRSSRYDQSRSPHRETLSPASRRSPVHRSRSPLSPRGAEYIPHSHYHAFHEKYRPVLLPASYVHGKGRREGRNSHFEATDEKKELSFPRKESPREPITAGEYQTNDKIQRANVQPGDEPPVFVLPNDYDIVSGIDPRIASIQDKRPTKFFPVSHPKEEEKQKEIQSGDVKVKDEFQNSPNGSNGECYSPKSSTNASNEVVSNGGDSPDSSTNNSQKLYCKICSGVFPTKSLLYKHLRGHTSDEKPFKCNECGQGFTLSSNLRQHRIIHRGYKPFQCEFCGKKFMRSNVYKQHRRIHTGEEMHKCSLCPSEFLQKYALLKHMKKNHDIDAVEN